MQIGIKPVIKTRDNILKTESRISKNVSNIPNAISSSVSNIKIKKLPYVYNLQLTPF